MTVKEYLSRPKELKEEIRCDLDNLAALRSIVENRTTHLSFTAGRNPSKNKDAFERTMIRITEAEEKIEEKKARLEEMQVEVIGMIAQLKKPRLRKVLMLHYINGLSWEEIAKKIDRTESRVFQMHREGLRRLEKLQLHYSKL